MKGPSSEFERLLEESFKKRQSIEPGSRHEAKVTAVKNDYVFIRTIENKITGNISTEEWREEVLPKVGDSLVVYFLKENSGDFYFTTCLSGDNLTEENMEMAAQYEIPVLGQMLVESNGGWDVKLGSHPAFVPFSQLDGSLKGTNIAGKRIKFVISEIGKKQNKIVLSQKKIADKERETKKQLLREELKAGMFVSCTVKSIHKFGLIVDMDGFDALVPQSEATYKKNADLTTEFRVGETLRAKILTLDWVTNKISLSVKDFLSDPWSGKLPFKESDIVTGTLESIKPFGLFVRLGDDFSGLVPNKETGVPSRTPLNTVFNPGQKLEVFVMEINPEKRQIALSISKAAEAKDRMEYQEYMSKEESTGAVSSFGLALQKSLEKKNKK
ncbi:S1 RNA-binding domain-containing protein [Leptospira sp. 85282-16]|uniref:S1 RNA-binding domain-containing protein n=1 Tax=Leptospira montravelensis TaxID=2484961 RepID=A0ABY2LLF1_9LEPT|nr:MULTISPECIES: S1 RNA-binding domain-containing protein [Leptospira]MCT8333370.1 S1 RNA-binding domain-containing protein [Leptospira sp. 85282-16]TGK79815.1 S1 RNA-binding domain-containing protein [Leptospira montravelensis]TGK99979.1 S1 RNA-binding domain-containing protein [Leptospira montravelensis]